MDKWKNLVERAAWTLLQAGVGLEAVNLLELPLWLAVPVAGALSAVKTALATKYSKAE